MNNLKDWASKELELLAQQSDNNEYVKACCNSAYKAFSSLTEDGHSGASISLTKEILDRLIDGNPLTPITEEDFKNVEDCVRPKSKDMKSEKQCPRMSSLFREEFLDGKIVYTDINRFLCYSADYPTVAYHSGLVDKVMNELFPISLPYTPSPEPYSVYCEDFLTSSENGDYDTYGIYYTVYKGERIEINKFFKYVPEESEEFRNIGNWVPITEETFNELKKHKIVF